MMLCNKLNEQVSGLFINARVDKNSFASQIIDLEQKKQNKTKQKQKQKKKTEGNITRSLQIPKTRIQKKKKKKKKDEYRISVEDPLQVDRSLPDRRVTGALGSHVRTVRKPPRRGSPDIAP